MAKIQIHGVNASPFVRKTRVVLAEKGIDYELIPVMPIGVSDEYKKISPLGKIPCYQDGDYVLPDSSCIIAYLERIHPNPAIYPADPKQFGRALWYEEYGDTKAIESIGPIFFQRVVRAKIMKEEPDESLVNKHLTELCPPVFDYLEGEVGDSDGIVGGRFSVADVALGSVFVNFQHAGEKVDATRWPKLAAYVEHVHARPSFKGIIEEEKAAFASL
ncbi:MAG: glutathione S-transferase family protein [Proteobacteria bacterium]|nr:glutathione S-transferase family protein [Pseudomonadota bacterium]